MSKHVAVAQAIKALVARALPGADVRGMTLEEAKPARISPLGMAIVRSGDLGEPEIDLSPPTWWWERRLPVELANYQSSARSAQEVAGDMLMAIAGEIEADRTLGGLCIHLDAEAPADGESETIGAQPFGWTDFAIIASYSTTGPLG